MSNNSSSTLHESHKHNVIANAHITLATNLPLVGNKLNVNELPVIKPLPLIKLSEIASTNAHEPEEVCNTM